MIKLTLTDSAGAVRELSLPAPIDELTRHPSHFTLTDELISIDFTSPDAELNAWLKACLLPLPAESAKELHLFGYLLDRMEDYHREVLCNHLPKEPGALSDLIQRSIYISDRLFLRDGTKNDNVRPLRECPQFVDEHDMDETLRREFRSNLDRTRLTGGQLFEKVVERARESGDLARFDGIHEYILPEEHDKTKITNYEFDFIPIVNYGCEGIYIDCSFRGGFDQGEDRWLSVGTIKTLENDLNAAKIMGELCGVLLHHESQYVNSNLWRFTPTEEMERDIARKLESEQTQGHGMTQQMG